VPQDSAGKRTNGPAEICAERPQHQASSQIAQLLCPRFSRRQIYQSCLNTVKHHPFLNAKLISGNNWGDVAHHMPARMSHAIAGRRAVELRSEKNLANIATVCDN